MKRRNKCRCKGGFPPPPPAAAVAEEPKPPAKEIPKQFNLYRELEQVLTIGLANLRSEATAGRNKIPVALAPKLDHLAISARLAIVEYFVSELVDTVGARGPTIPVRFDRGGPWPTPLRVTLTFDSTESNGAPRA